MDRPETTFWKIIVYKYAPWNYPFYGHGVINGSIQAICIYLIAFLMWSALHG